MEKYFAANKRAFEKIAAAVEAFEQEINDLSPGGAPVIRSMAEQREIASICDAVQEVMASVKMQKRKAKGSLPPSHLPLWNSKFEPPTHSEIQQIFPKLNPGGQPAPDVHLAEEVKITQKNIAEWLGVDPKQVRRWVKGESNLPNSVWRILLLMNGIVTETPISRDS